MTGRLRYLILAIIWLSTLTVASFWLLSGQVSHLTFAAGPRDSESFQLATSIAEVFNQIDPDTRIDVFETNGSAENVRLITSGQVDFATIQADTPVDTGVSAVAKLYLDAYQLIVNTASDIHRFPDLAGHRVAIATAGSGQNRPFWQLAKHYALDKDDLVAMPMSSEAADFAMASDQVDAVFWIRAPGNSAIRSLVRDHPVRLVPIHQSAALALTQPAIVPGIIPAGSYRGAPPIPAEDLPTVELSRLLVARSDLDDDQVQAMTRLLFENRSSLIALDSLAGFISAINIEDGISMPLHPGAQRYYDREKPGLLQSNARIAGTLLYVSALLISGFLALRSHLSRARRIRVGDYNFQLMKIAESARSANSTVILLELKDNLLHLLQKIVNDLDQERVTQDEFEHFRFVWQAVDTIVGDHIKMNIDINGSTSTRDGEDNLI